MLVFFFLKTVSKDFPSCVNIRYQGSSSAKSPFLSCHEYVVVCVFPLSPERKRTIFGKTFLRTYRLNKRVYIHKHDLFLF